MSMTGFDEEEDCDIVLLNGIKLTPCSAKCAIEEAMSIIATVGTTGIEHKHKEAEEWLRRYFPNKI